MTIDQGADIAAATRASSRSKGQGLEEAAHQYFRQSEQIPTRVRLAVAEQFERGPPAPVAPAA